MGIWPTLKTVNMKEAAMGETTRNPTKGEAMVRMDFNPSGEGVVYDVKRHSAAIIDLVEKIRLNNAHNQEVQRLCSLAQTAYEEASMWAVKAATSK